MSNDRPAPKQHEAWLIQLLRRLFERARFKVEDHKKVGELPLEIDMIVISAGEEAPPSLSELPPLFQYFRRHNVMELKTEKDRLEIADLLKLQAYAWLYMLPVLGYKQIGKDIYRCDLHMLSSVIAFGDPPDESMPEELRVFSNPARRQSIILSQLVSGQPSPLLEAILDLYESEVFKLMSVKPEMLERFVQTFGKEKILSTFRKEDILATLNKEDLLAALSNDDMLNKLLVNLGPDQLYKKIEQASHN
jgi:hypothetical protein